MNFLHYRFALVLLPALVACAATAPDPLDEFEEVTPAMELEQPEAVPGGRYTEETVAHGKYLVKLLRCGSCHTDGSLIGQPNGKRLLAGSSVGIAFTNPLEDKHPGVVFPPNLTPDERTGLGGWSEEQIVNMIRTGTGRHGGRVLSVMPYQAYSGVSDTDARAIAAYLSSLPPVHHRVPENVARGQKTSAQYVHFGVYRSRK